MPGVGLQARVMNLVNLGVIHERLSDEPGALAMGAHAGFERLHPAKREEAVHRARHRAHRVLHEAELLDPLRVRRDDNPADQVRVSADVFRDRVHDRVGAQLQRAL